MEHAYVQQVPLRDEASDSTVTRIDELACLLADEPRLEDKQARRSIAGYTLGRNGLVTQPLATGSQPDPDAFLILPTDPVQAEQQHASVMRVHEAKRQQLVRELEELRAASELREMRKQAKAMR